MEHTRTAAVRPARSRVSFFPVGFEWAANPLDISSVSAYKKLDSRWDRTHQKENLSPSLWRYPVAVTCCCCGVVLLTCSWSIAQCWYCVEEGRYQGNWVAGQGEDVYCAQISSAAVLSWEEFRCTLVHVVGAIVSSRQASSSGDSAKSFTFTFLRPLFNF